MCNVVVGIWLIVEGLLLLWFKRSVKVSGSDKGVSDDRSIGSFTKFGSPGVNACFIQSGRRCVEVGGFKGISRICSSWFGLILIDDICNDVRYFYLYY